jgi:hypothetical protein
LISPLRPQAVRIEYTMARVLPDEIMNWDIKVHQAVRCKGF